MNLYAENGTAISDSRIADKGDFEISEYSEIEAITRRQLQDNPRLLSLGGDHSITYPIIKAFAAQYPKLDILHIDAHSDLYDAYQGDPFSHACPFARIMEDGLVNRLVQVGVRTLNPHQDEQARRFGVTIHAMKDWEPARLTRFKNPLYISLDMDGFDPAYAPGVSHQEPGGLSTRQVLNILQQIDTPVIGADIVEYNPDCDLGQMTAFLAAKMMKELLVKML
jgi:agmatinase